MGYLTCTLTTRTAILVNTMGAAAGDLWHFLILFVIQRGLHRSGYGTICRRKVRIRQHRVVIRNSVGDAPRVHDREWGDPFLDLEFQPAHYDVSHLLQCKSELCERLVKNLGVHRCPQPRVDVPCRKKKSPFAEETTNRYQKQSN